MAPSTQKKKHSKKQHRSNSIKEELLVVKSSTPPVTIIPAKSILTEVQQDCSMSNTNNVANNSNNKSSSNPRLFLLYGIIILQLAIFITELITDQFIHSVLILTDAYHHLFNSCNAILLVVCFKISNQMTVKNTFGWVRMEVLGMLTTITFIVALIFSLLIEGALQLLHLHEISGPTNVNVLLIFGIWSLFVNILYVLIINGVVTDKKYKQTTRIERSFSTANCETQLTQHPQQQLPSLSPNHPQDQSFSMKEFSSNDCSKVSISASSSSSSTSSAGNTAGDDNNNKLRSKPVLGPIRTTTKIEFLADPESDEKFEQQSNCFVGSAVQGLLSPSFLLFGSLVIILFRSTDWVNMVDPVVGVVTASLLCVTFFSQLKNTMFILMQTVPENVNILRLKKELLDKFDQVENIHELHIWRLTSSKIVATCHIVLPMQTTGQYRQLFERIKLFLQDNYGITYATIQPEFRSLNQLDQGPDGDSQPEEGSKTQQKLVGENDCFMKCPQQLAGSECEQLTCCKAGNQDGDPDYSTIGHGHSHGGHHHH